MASPLLRTQQIKAWVLDHECWALSTTHGGADLVAASTYDLNFHQTTQNTFWCGFLLASSSYSNIRKKKDDRSCSFTPVKTRSSMTTMHLCRSEVHDIHTHGNFIVRKDDRLVVRSSQLSTGPIRGVAMCKGGGLWPPKILKFF